MNELALASRGCSGKRVVRLDMDGSFRFLAEEVCKEPTTVQYVLLLMCAPKSKSKSNVLRAKR